MNMFTLLPGEGWVSQKREYLKKEIDRLANKSAGAGLDTKRKSKAGTKSVSVCVCLFVM